MRLWINYFLVGLLATSFHYLILILLVEVGHLKAETSTFLGALCGAFLAYILNHRVTFTSTQKHRQSLPKFMLIALFMAIVNGSLVGVSVTYLNWHYLQGQVVATSLLFILSFLLNKKWTF